MAFSPGMLPLHHSGDARPTGAEADLTRVRMEILGVETE
jgi:hypothetical protein